MFRLKFNALMFALVIGLLTAFGQTAQGQTIINPSFEADNVPPSPGYGAITGWTVTGFEGSSGINNATGPFADNGAIPDGQKVAFLNARDGQSFNQQGGKMRQTVSGFTVGAQYRLRYFENVSLVGAGFPRRIAYLQATVGGLAVVPTHEVLEVGGTNPYVLKVSEPFTATAEAMEIAFIAGGRHDYTVLLDNITVVPDNSVVLTNLVVTNNLDNGAGSLRQTVIDAPAFSTIRFSDAVRGAISLTTGGITINKNLTIMGPGADALIVRSGGFSVNEGVTATISGLTIADGGGIGNSGNLTVTDSVVRSNQGNGIYSVGNLVVVNSVLSDNDGGAIAASCPTLLIDNAVVCPSANQVTITNSTISHNRSGIGAGINILLSEVEITNSSITGNIAFADPRGIGGFGSGAGIYNKGGRLTITNSTIAGNEEYKNSNCLTTNCPPVGDGITVTAREPTADEERAFGELNLSNATVTDNIYAGGGRTKARNSIINALTGSLNSQGYNLIVNPAGSAITGDTTGNILGANPRLGPLGYYGGTTLTRALLTGSPAINTGNTATSPATDQRGAPRVGTADIGAFEVNNSANSGNFVVQLPDAFTEIAYSHLLVDDASGFTYSLTGGALPTGISLSTTESRRVLVSGRTAQTGVFAFSVTATDGTNSFVTDYRLRVLDSGLPPYPGGCLSNPVVANSSDSGEGTLRQAVIDACPGGTITFGEAARGRISLTTGPIEINKNLTITGPGADALTIRNGAGYGSQNRVVYVNAGVTAVLSGLTISDGYAGGGGGIFNLGNLTVRNAVITNNHNPRPGAGGGIQSSGTLALVNSTVTGNGDNGTALGGGIALFGSSATITDSTVSGNLADEGGGIYANFNSSVTLTNSTIGGNASDGPGGGLYLDGGIATLTNCTVSQNQAGGQDPAGGGIFVRGAGTLTLINSTIANNQLYASTAPEYSGAGVSNGSVFHSGGTVNVRNSIIAGNTLAGTSLNLDFYGSLTSQGYNLIGSNRGAQITGVTTGNIVGTFQAPINARLGPLADNGGPTMTNALLPDSPAINTGNTATSPATDQRGVSRVGTADIGAFEFNDSTPTPTPTPTITPTPSPTPTPNTPPNAAADAYSVNEDTTLNINAPGVLGNDTDGENNSLTAVVQTSPANAASFTLNANGSFSYTPTANFNGADSFTYTAFDGSFASSAATVTITVNAVNDVPVANGGSITTNEDTASSAFILTGSDADGDSLTFEIVTAPVKGTYNAATGIYTPNANANGSDSFTFIAKDAVSQSSSAMVLITITPVNDAPTAAGQSVTTDEDTAKAITLSGSDVDGDALTYAASQPSHGSVSCTGASCIYRPTANYSGADSFTFKANDGQTDSAAATVSITVNPVNDPPTATAQSVTTDEDTAKAITLSGSDPDGANTPLTYTIVGQPLHGTLSGTAPNLTYTPAANFYGTDSFTFRVNDGSLDSETATISITINAVNDAPTLSAIANQTLAWGYTVSFTPTASDVDVPANNLTFSLSCTGGVPSNVSFNTATGAFGWTPSAAQAGATYNCSITVNDNSGAPNATATRSFSVTVNSHRTALVYTGAIAGQYSDPATLTATLTDLDANGSQITGQVINFQLGSQTASGLSNGSTTPGAILILSQAAAIVSVTPSFAGSAGYASSTGAAQSFIISRENTSVGPSASNPYAVKVSTAGGTAASITLQADVSEVADGSLGDITKAVPVTFTLAPVGPGPAITKTAGVLTNVNGVLTVSATFANVPVNVYDITITVGGNFYSGSASSVLAVYDPSLGFTTGGGKVIHNGVLSEFGFNVKYLKSGNVQGQMLYVEHRATGDVVVKSNAMDSLSIVKGTAGSGSTAVIIGRATLIGVGNYRFRTTVVDNGEPGTNDKFGLQVTNPAGEIVTDLTFSPLTLSGGNIQVP